MHFNFTVSHGVPILSVGNSVVSVEGIFHQASVLRATKYRVYATTDLTTGQSLVTSCFFLWVLWSWPVISICVDVNELSYAIKEQRLLEINGVHSML